jgi:hypothetical protein
MSSPLSFSEAGDLARTHTHPITREPVAFAARSPAQLIWTTPVSSTAIETNPLSINRLTQLAS